MYEYVDVYVLVIVRYVTIYYRACSPLGAGYIHNKRFECIKTCRLTCSHIFAPIGQYTIVATEEYIIAPIV